MCLVICADALATAEDNVPALIRDLRVAFDHPGPNPALEVERRKVPKRLPDFLRPEEVQRVLAVLSDDHRPLFAAAIYTGLRKGELAGLRKTDVDFDAGLLSVCRSYERDTTKGNRAAAIPIATELAPYLETAIRRSKGPPCVPRPRR